jgi:hypothetical protein
MIGKPDSFKCQTRPSDFPGSNSSSWSLELVGSTEGGTLCRSTRRQSRENRAKERVFDRWQSKAWCGEKSRGGGSRVEQGFRGKGRDQDRRWDQFTMAAKLDSLVSQTGPYDFFSFRTKEALEYYCTRDGSSTSLVNPR